MRRAVDGLDDGPPGHLERGGGILDALDLAAGRGRDSGGLERRSHFALVRDDLGCPHREAREPEPVGEACGGQHGLVGAHRRDRDRLDLVRPQVGEDSGDVDEVPDDPDVGVREQRCGLCAVHDADLVPERARLLEQPEL